MDWDLLVPLGICVALPVLIIWLNSRVRLNETNKRAEVMLKALEAGKEIDPELLKGAKRPLTLKEKLLKRLTCACITSLIGVALLVMGIITSNASSWQLSESPAPMGVFAGGVLLAIGLSLLAVYFVGKKMLAKEIAAQEQEMTQRQ